ncbi:hypothetical protein LXL04_029974 [Taraxacum kok-saghyz]
MMVGSSHVFKYQNPATQLLPPTLLPPTIAASSDAASSSSDFSSYLKPAASSDAASPSADFIALFLRFQFLLPLSFDFTVAMLNCAELLVQLIYHRSSVPPLAAINVHMTLLFLQLIYPKLKSMNIKVDKANIQKKKDDEKARDYIFW